MASSARIDELQKKFDENPKRYFAPLANEFRKAGDLEQAIALCRAFLPQQPGHMSGHIVFGQALFEAGQHEESRAVFETALSLDPENLIALRYLGDIAMHAGATDVARSWYRRVLDADPRNEEIAAVLEALPAAPGPAPAPDSAAAAADGASDLASWAAAETSSDAAGEPRDTRSESAGASAPEAVGANASPAASAPSLDLESFEVSIAEDAAARAPEIERSEEVRLELPGAAHDATAASAGADAQEGSESSRSGDAAASSSGPANQNGFEVMEFVPPPRDERASAVEGLQAGGGDETPAAFVTETMAELYLQQGFHQEALAVYRQLLAHNPGDAGLRERVEQLASGASSSLGMAAVSDEVIESARRRRSAASVRTIRAFLGGLAGRRAPARAADDRAGWSNGAAAAGQDGAAFEAASSAEGGDPDAHASAPESGGGYAEAYDAGAASETPPSSDYDGLPDAETTVANEPWEGDDNGFDGYSPPEHPPEEGSDSGAPLETIWDPAAEGAAEQQGWSSEPQPEEPARSPEPRPPRLSGEMGSVNTLFAGAEIPSQDDSAATTLAGAFLDPPEPTPRAGRPSRAASTELSLDHVFREPGPRGAAEGRRPAFSFDQFFSEETSAPERGAADSDADGDPPDDIAQFNSWLEGLKKR